MSAGGFYMPNQEGGAPPPQQQGQYYQAPQGNYGAPVTAQPGQYQPMLPQGGQPQFGAPVQGQEGQEWMGAPAEQSVPLNCPPGLEYLTLIDQLIIKQKFEALEAVAGVLGYGFETQNKYKIKNSLGQNVFKAKEDSNCCMRLACGPIRPFNMIITDNADQEVMSLNRPFNCNSCCFPCCLQEIEVCSPPGTTIGWVKQNWTCIKPSFSILDADENEILKIVGPWCTYSICGDVEFQIMTPDERVEVGKISKQWSGMLKEAFTDADNFGISFPMDLDVKAKATMIGAAFLIDYMFFEKKANKEGDGLGML